MPGDGLRIALVQTEQVPPHGRVEVGGLHLVRQIGFLRPRWAAIEGTPATTGAFAAPATVLRGVTVCSSAFAVRAAAPFVAIRTRAMAFVIAALEAGRTVPRRVTALIEIAATLEPAALARFTATDIASSARGLVPTLETTTLGCVTPAPEATTVTATLGGVLAAESATVAGTATLESAASTGVPAGPIAAPRIVAALPAITPAFEATTFA
ncbi:hypothetical protein IFM12276_42150 [Nocardia sputorum]|uniref:Uncharacterized protein n=1 Tax=Nocardia sputorum TaxID=2984338 RepID=A0ABN6U7B8_9NOCA|nr:hypothetical protein IFM12276_42150 [Nocardia sputorum]